VLAGSKESARAASLALRDVQVSPLLSVEMTPGTPTFGRPRRVRLEKCLEITPVVRHQHELFCHEHGQELMVFAALKATPHDVISIESARVGERDEGERHALVEEEPQCHGCLGGRPCFGFALAKTRASSTRSASSDG